MRWLRDPKLARTLSRFSWVVLVAAFVLLTRFDTGEREPLLLLGLAVTVVALNAPVMYGLSISQKEGATKAYRVVALMLIFRLAATAGVVWFVSQQ